MNLWVVSYSRTDDTKTVLPVLSLLGPFSLSAVLPASPKSWTVMWLREQGHTYAT